MSDAGEGRVPVGQLLGRRPPRPSRWRALAQWRDWSLPIKLGAVTLIPIVIAMVLGAITLAGQIGRSDRSERIDHLVQLGGATRTLLTGLEQERTVTADLLTQGNGVDSPDLRRIRGEVDRAATAVTDAAQRAADSGSDIAGPRQQVTEQLGRLAQLRKQVGAGQVGAVESVTEYSAITGALLELDTAVVAGAGDDGLGGTAGALHELLVARDAASIQQALIGYGIGRGGLAPSEINQIRTSHVRMTDRIGEFRTSATDAARHDFDTTVRGEAFDTYDRLAGAVLAGQDTDGDALTSTTAQEWTESAGAVVTAMGQVADRMGAEATATADETADSAGTAVLVLSVLLLVSFALAALVVFVITRQLLRSLAVLRTSALQVADHELPEVVRDIQDGGSPETDIQAVPVDTHDEIGQVARAFDAVHSEALRLAAEQAAMRTGYASVFVNLSRRSQSLVQRQLQLIERLERDEEDADQLATLFQLDHLATRMRRNNENLMVLSGAEPGRRSGRPVHASDVLRAAVSEIEQYPRVLVRTPPPVHVKGYVAGDLIRLVAELLDNATAFSAPETKVTVASRLMEGGTLLIDILDKGIGMNEAEVAEANGRLAVESSLDLATSRRMGLFVVGRLARRHGIGVALHGGKDIVGVRATVTVPADLVTRIDEQPPRHDVPPARSGHPASHPPRQAPASTPPAQGGALPRRHRNGTAHPGMPGHGENGHGAAPAAPTGTEISGTALFTPLPPGTTGTDTAAPHPSGEPHRPGRSTVGWSGEDSGHGGALAAPDWPADPEGGGDPGTPPAAAPSDSAGLTAEGGDTLSGRQLFEAHTTAVSDWWSAASSVSEEERAAQRAAVDNAETTPIFDEMLSAWFRSVTDADAEQARGRDWGSVDESWRTVQEVSSRTPAGEYTEAGLPKRRRGERLLPGSAVPQARDAPAQATAEQPQMPARDAADVRGRLASFQQGVNRGRRHRRAESAPDADVAPDSPVAHEQPSGEHSEHSGAPERSPVRSRGAAAADGASWAFADEQWRMGEAAPAPAPTYTAAGLPRRRRGEQLLPGSVGSGEAVRRPRTERDPADVRGRLTNFQQGVRRGRHRTAQAAESSEDKVEDE